MSQKTENFDITVKNETVFDRYDLAYIFADAKYYNEEQFEKSNDFETKLHHLNKLILASIQEANVYDRKYINKSDITLTITQDIKFSKELLIFLQQSKVEGTPEQEDFFNNTYKWIYKFCDEETINRIQSHIQMMETPPSPNRKPFTSEDSKDLIDRILNNPSPPYILTF